MDYKEAQLSHMKQAIVMLNKKGSNFRVCYLRNDEHNYNGHEFLRTTTFKIPDIGSTINLKVDNIPAEFIIKRIHGYQGYFTTPNDFIDIIIELKTEISKN